jgi:putative transposase
MESSEDARSKAVDDENARLRRIVANLTLDLEAAKWLIEKTRGALIPKSRGEGVARAWRVGQRRACRLTGCTRSGALYRTKRTDELRLVEPPKSIAMERRCFGYRRIGLMLRSEGIVVNHKRAHRIYRNLGLQLRPCRKHGVRYVRENEVVPVAHPNERWSIDFSFPDERVVRTFERIAKEDQSAPIQFAPSR